MTEKENSVERGLVAGVIGLGVGEQHIAGYRKHPKCRVKSICDIDETKLKDVASRHTGVVATRAAEEILDDPEIDVVSIASYDDAHHTQVVRAIRNGKHVFVEKPLCLYEEEAREIRDQLVANPRIRMSSNLILRRSPRFVWLYDQIRQGALGRIYYSEGDYNYGRLHKLTEDWRGRLDFYSLVYGGGVHMIDLMMWLTGQRITEVAAVGNRICSEGTRFKNFDLVSSLLAFAGGSNGKMSVNGGCVFPHYHGVTVYGTDATFVNAPQDGLLYRSRDPRIEPDRVREAYPGFAKGDLLYDFVEAILTGGALAVDVDDVFRSMSVCFAIEKSVNTGRSTRVDYI